MDTYHYHDQTYSVQLDRLPDGSYRATISDRVYTFTAEAIEQGWALAFPESRARSSVYVAVEGDTRTVNWQGETYTLNRESQRQKRSSGAKLAGGGITAQMPGQVREVLVAEGDTVARGQVLVMLEAMKMEMRVTAPADGVVKRLLVAAGDVVSRGQALVDLA